MRKKKGKNKSLEQILKDNNIRWELTVDEEIALNDLELMMDDYHKKLKEMDEVKAKLEEMAKEIGYESYDKMMKELEMEAKSMGFKTVDEYLKKRLQDET